MSATQPSACPRKPAAMKNKMRFVIRDEMAEYGEKVCLDAPEKIYSFFLHGRNWRLWRDGKLEARKF